MNPATARIAHQSMSVDTFLAEVEKFTRNLQTLSGEIDSAIVPDRNHPVFRRVEHLFKQSQFTCRDFENAHQGDPELVRQVQATFREMTDPWFRQSWIAHRARTKPSGFAGDFEMLIKLYNEATPARGLGGYLDACICDLPLARAVRARLIAARNFLLNELQRREGQVRILDIASGPCREFRDWPRPDHCEAVEIVAFDNDPQALQYVREQIVPELPESVALRPERYNALRTRSSSATIRKFGQFDVIYSVGLCDYLSDEHLVGMLRGWRETLRDDGVLLIAFKDDEQYDKTPYQWHLDWFFYQRTLEDCLELYVKAGFDVDQMEVTRDRTGIIMNFVARNSRSDRRFDAADSAERRQHFARSEETVD